MDYRAGKDGEAVCGKLKPCSSTVLRFQSCSPEDRFDKDEFRQLFTDGQTRVADLADQIGVAGEQTDDLVFADADFPQAILQFRRGTNSSNTDLNARLHEVQRTDAAMYCFGANRIEC